MRDDDDGKYRERIAATSRLFRRRPHDFIAQMEELGFTYMIDDNEDAEEIAEENGARPATKDQINLVSWLEGTETPDESLLTLWRAETGRPDSPVALWRRYFRAGNPQLKKLISFGLDRTPVDSDLLAQLAFLHEFLPMPKELLLRYTRACNEEGDPRRFAILARDFDDAADSFGYDALAALRERHAGDGMKTAIIENFLIERKAAENENVA